MSSTNVTLIKGKYDTFIGCGTHTQYNFMLKNKYRKNQTKLCKINKT